MKCPKCGVLLEEDSKFCSSCGANIEADVKNEETVSTDSKQEKNSKIMDGANKAFGLLSGMENSNKGRKMIGLVVGTILIIIGLTRIFSAGVSISSTSFGADFYTYSYQGIVAIAEILSSIEVTLGWVIVAVGAAIDVISLK